MEKTVIFVNPTDLMRGDILRFSKKPKNFHKYGSQFQVRSVRKSTKGNVNESVFVVRTEIIDTLSEKRQYHNFEFKNEEKVPVDRIKFGPEERELSKKIWDEILVLHRKQIKEDLPRLIKEKREIDSKLWEPFLIRYIAESLLITGQAFISQTDHEHNKSVDLWMYMYLSNLDSDHEATRKLIDGYLADKGQNEGFHYRWDLIQHRLHLYILEYLSQTIEGEEKGYVRRYDKQIIDSCPYRPRPYTSVVIALIEQEIKRKEKQKDNHNCV